MPIKKFVTPQYLLSRRRLVLGWVMGGLMLAASALQPGLAASDEPLRVVATFSILGDMVKEIGGDRVAVTTIVGVNRDAHHFEPTPSDAEALQNAQVLVLNGLDFEAWLPRLAQAAGFNGLQVLASQGVKVRNLNQGAEPVRNGDAGHDHGHDHDGVDTDHTAPQAQGGEASHSHPRDVDPHAWQDLANGMIYARNIAAGLGQADPENALYYEGRAVGYIARMKSLDSEVRTAFAALPPERRRVITSHSAFGYFGDAYGIEFIAVAGISNEAEPSAQEVARIINIVREKDVGGVFVENMTSPRLAQQIARESGTVMGGTLYADALGPPDEPASTYLGMFSWNAGRLLYVLRPKPQN